MTHRNDQVSSSLFDARLGAEKSLIHAVSAANCRHREAKFGTVLTCVLVPEIAAEGLISEAIEKLNSVGYGSRMRQP